MFSGNCLPQASRLPLATRNHAFTFALCTQYISIQTLDFSFGHRVNLFNLFKQEIKLLKLPELHWKKIQAYCWFRKSLFHIKLKELSLKPMAVLACYMLNENGYIMVESGDIGISCSVVSPGC